MGEAFSYRVEGTYNTDLVGSVIKVPMGKNTHRAIVLAAREQVGSESLTLIEKPEVLLSNLLTLIQCELILFMAAKYFSPLHKVLRLFVPEKIWNGAFVPKRAVSVSLASSERYTLSARMKTMLAMEAYMHGKEGVAKAEIVARFSAQSYKKAVELGMLQEEYGALETVFEDRDAIEPRVLTKEQQDIYDTVITHPDRAYLLHGVTGAGKTEIYLHLALYYAKQKKQTLLIVPEIVLTPQLRMYFSKIFGAKISIFHSKLSEGERLQEWHRVKQGESVIILGSRSAFFAPFQDLGLIVVDEEHEWTYKNEQNPRYYIHSVAYHLHEQMHSVGKQCTLLFGSATPRVETYARTFSKTHPIYLLTLAQKIFEQTPNTSSLENV